ncbi:TPA: hypothetical protein NIB55_005874 [Pseudomonas aeruginosa]|nr:hypothetical protein [Pseudomonas aeruginosa]
MIRLERTTDQQPQVAEQQTLSVISAARSSGRNVLIGLGILAALAALFALLVFLGEAVPPVWHGWARIITRDYSDVTPALWINWLSMIAVAWAIGVAYQLGNTRFDASVKFAGLAVAIILFGVMPASCALLAATEDMKFPVDSSVPLLDKLAAITAIISFIGLGFGAVVGICAAISNGLQHDGTPEADPPCAGRADLN